MHANDRTHLERKSDLEFEVTRIFNGPPRLVFDAWTKPELLKRWWIPKGMGLSFVSCEMDARTGGSYRFVFTFDNEPSKPMAFHGRYIEVMPPSRLVWTNEEGGPNPEDQSITTVVFEEHQGKTRMVMRERYPTKEKLEAAMASGAFEGPAKSHDQLDELLATLAK